MIEVGEYVRINNDFRLIALGIGKVIRINQDTIYVKMNFELPFAFKIENIVKHSKNTIDLIEEGDIVRYKLKGLNSEYITIVKKYHDARSNEKWLLINGYKLEQVEILEILTKEQYKQNCYRLEETC